MCVSYLSLKLSNSEHTSTVISTVLEKYNIENGRAEDYTLAQLLPGNRGKQIKLVILSDGTIVFFFFFFFFFFQLFFFPWRQVKLAHIHKYSVTKMYK